MQLNKHAFYFKSSIKIIAYFKIFCAKVHFSKKNKFRSPNKRTLQHTA